MISAGPLRYQDVFAENCRARQAGPNRVSSGTSPFSVVSAVQPPVRVETCNCTLKRVPSYFQMLCSGRTKRNGVLIDHQPERPSGVIDAPKRLATLVGLRPRCFESRPCPTPFHQQTPQYSVNNSRSTPSNTETHASKNSTPLPHHSKTECQKIGIRKSFSESVIDLFQDCR